MTQRMKVLVTGATGKQGGAILRRLREKGHAVRALTRSADSVAAKALVANGAEIAVGHLEDRASLDRALDGVDAMFLMSTPFEAGTAAETRQGVTGANAAKDRHIYFVYTSVGWADRKTGIPHFESKYEVERHIEDVGARAAIIAPVYFMENAVTFYREQLKEGVYATPLAPGRKLAQIAVDDIAAAAVAALERPDQFAGKRYDLAGDDLTGSDAVAILSRVTGIPFSYFQVPMDVIRRNMGEDGVKMYEWFERVGYTFDSATLRRDFPEIRWHSFEAWAGEQDWKTIFAKWAGAVLEQTSDSSGTHVWLVLMKAHRALAPRLPQHWLVRDVFFWFPILEALLHKGPPPVSELGRLRYFLRHDPALIGPVLRIFLWAVEDRLKGL